MGCLQSSTKVEPFNHPKENGHVPTSQQNGHIPSSKVPDTPRETLGQLPNQENVYNNNAGKDTRIVETPLSGQAIEEQEATTTVQPISLTQNTVESGLDEKSESQNGTPRNLTARTLSTRAGNQSQRSTSREPIVVPTMPMTEDDLLRSHYTIKEISIHNSEKGFIDIFPLRTNIYSTTKFKEAMKIVVKQKYDNDKFKKDNKIVENYDYEDFNKYWKSSPIFLVMFEYTKMHIRFSDIKPELPGCKVADVFNQGELYEDIIKDSKDTLQYLKGESNITEYQKEYQQLLERFLNICDNINSVSENNSNDSNEPSGQDPNTIEFPLPEPILADCTVLRKWIEKWQPFDTDIPKEGVLAELPDKVVNALSDPVELQDICRVSSDGLPDFDFTIDGEAAWAVIELDLVKNDKTTEKQEKIWRSRDNRTDLNDPMFLLSKQTRLEMYFINKYEWERSKLDQYRGFTTRLQRAWKEFQALCKVEEFTTVPEDEY